MRIDVVEQADISALESAVAELNEGEIDSFVSLMSSDVSWVGVTSGWLWWRHTPS